MTEIIASGKVNSKLEASNIALRLVAIGCCGLLGHLRPLLTARHCALSRRRVRRPLRTRRVRRVRSARRVYPPLCRGRWRRLGAARAADARLQRGDLRLDIAALEREARDQLVLPPDG